MRLFRSLLSIHRLPITAFAVPGVLFLMSFLAYSSQFLFFSTGLLPLSTRQRLVFNTCVVCMFICYARSCLTDSGTIPQRDSVDTLAKAAFSRKRWCRKCESFKPPRAHHCKKCGKCIPKMDHHCPWTSNCVSHRTIPHFTRFILYAVIAMSYLQYFLFVCGVDLWDHGNYPSHLGPSMFQLSHLFLLVILNSMTLFALSILLVREIWCIAVNTTTIEGWEIERHAALLRRARAFGGYLSGANGVQVKIVKQEFPYDIGIWQNLVQNMGSRNVLSWFWPFSASPSLQSGLCFEVNGFEDPSTSWPPPDPDRIVIPSREDFSYASQYHTSNFNQNDVNAFRQRQHEDLKRWEGRTNVVRKRRDFIKRYETLRESENIDNRNEHEDDQQSDGEEAWKNSEGERLGDFGVDEDLEFYDEDDVPLARLISRRKASISSRLTLGAINQKPT